MQNDESGDRCGALPRPGSQRKHPCRSFPAKGSNRCGKHGANSPQAKAAAEVRNAEAAMHAVVERVRPAPVSDPFFELTALAGEVIQWKDLLADKVHEMHSYAYQHDAGEQIRGHVVLFERAMDRCAGVLTAIAKLDIDRRLAAIGEDQAARIADAFMDAVDALDVPMDSPLRRRIADAFQARLTAVA